MNSSTDRAFKCNHAAEQAILLAIDVLSNWGTGPDNGSDWKQARKNLRMAVYQWTTLAVSLELGEDEEDPAEDGIMHREPTSTIAQAAIARDPSRSFPEILMEDYMIGSAQWASQIIVWIRHFGDLEGLDAAAVHIYARSWPGLAHALGGISS